MKHIITLATLLWLIAVGCNAQAIVKMPVVQNKPFEVSTNRVDVVMPADGGGLLLGGDVVIAGGSGTYGYRWYNTSNSSLSTESTFYASSPGIYKLDITDSCDCLQTVEFNIGAAGIEDVRNEEIEIGPNPTTGLIRISGAEVEQIAVVDMAGRLVAIVNNCHGDGGISCTADLSTLCPGEYILTITATNGKRHSYRLVKI